MGWDELVTRLKQEVWKRSDAWTWRLGAGSVGKEVRSSDHLPENGRGSLAETPLTGTAVHPARFFFEPDDLGDLARELGARVPLQMEATLRRAENISQHRFDLLGYAGLDWGRAIEWQRDPVSGKRAPRKPWYRIHFLDYNVAGDHKVVWELNRHQHLVTLAKAYVLSHESRWVDELVRQWRQWRDENPYPWGINWASSLEIAFRSLSWLWVGRLLAGSSAMPDTFEQELVSALALNARHIERNFSTYWSPNTHLLGEAVALFFIGLLSPSLGSAPHWRELGWRVVLEQAERQVQADGTHFEQSVYYHVYALDFFLHARILAARNGIRIPEELDETILRMLQALQGLAQGGPPPRIGDDDGGRVFDPTRNRAVYLTDPLCVGSALYHRADLKPAIEDPTEEAIWLLGLKGVRDFDALEAPRLVPRSQSFVHGGYYVMAATGADWPAAENQVSNPTDGCAQLSAQLVIRAPSRIAGRCGHAHADALSVALSAGGEEWLTDPGTFCYVSADTQRDLFRSTEAHNTVRLDQQSQAEPAGPFAWRAMPEVRLEHWIAGRWFDLFAGSHDGYQRLHAAATHRRWIFHRKGGFWLVRDLVEGNGEHVIEQFWHFAAHLVPSYTPPGFTLTPMQNSGARRRYQGILILPVEAHGWSPQIYRGHVSPAYGSKEPAAVVRFATRTTLPAELAVVLDPLAEITEETRRLATAGDDADRQVRAFRYNRGSESHWFFFANGAHYWKVGSWTSDARFAYCSAEPRRKNIDVAVCSGSTLAFDGRPLARADRRVERLEAHKVREQLEAACSDSDAEVSADSVALESILNSEI
jgi:hypothetical protein